MTTTDEQIIKQFKSFVESQNGSVELSAEEIRRVRSLIDALEMVESWGKLGKFALFALTAVSGALIAWGQIVERLAQK